MARIRTIKPEFWHDEKVGTLKRDIRLLYIGLWNLADDEGVCKSNPTYIKSSLFPYDDDLRISELNTWLASLHKARMIIPFTFNKEGYYMIRTFSDHQVINRPSKSKWQDGFLENLIQEFSKDTHGTLTEPSHQEGKGKEQGNGKEGEGNTPAPEKKGKAKVLPHLFRDSKIFGTENFAAAISNTQYQDANVEYYHEVILNWSDSKEAKKSDWLAAAKNWMARDMTEGKFIVNGFKPKNGQSKSSNPKEKGTHSSVMQVFNEKYSKG